MRPSSSSRRPCPRTRAGKYSCISNSDHRYAIFELEYQANDGRIESKILFLMYAPDIIDTKEKFVIATTKDAVKKKLQPFNKEIQVNDWADLDAEAFIRYFKH